MTTRAAIYTRISSDREGEALGVQRQQDDVNRLAEQTGCTVVAVYVDNDRGASTRSKKKRPEYEAMLAAARTGAFDTILAYSNSRLTRRPREVEDLIDLHDRHGIRIRTVVSGDDDLATADGRMIARIKGGVDAAEAERTAERVSRAARQAAEAGKWHGGARPFGYEPDGTTIRDNEAQAIRDAYRTILAGGSIRSVMTKWNTHGLHTGRGRPWTTAGIRELLTSPRYVGRRAYRGRVVADATWPAIVDTDVWEAVGAIIADRKRKGPKSPRRLLTGIAVCDVCGRPVLGNGGPAGRPVYRCPDAHVTRTGAAVDDYVELTMVLRMSRPDFADVVNQTATDDDPDKERREQIRALNERLDRLATEWADGVLTDDQVAAASKRIRERLAELESMVSPRLRAASVFERFVQPGVDVAAEWEAIDDVDYKRAMISELAEVRILRAVRGRRGFDPATVAITFVK